MEEEVAREDDGPEDWIFPCEWDDEDDIGEEENGKEEEEDVRQDDVVLPRIPRVEFEPKEDELLLLKVED